MNDPSKIYHLDEPVPKTDTLRPFITLCGIRINNVGQYRNWNDDSIHVIWYLNSQEYGCNLNIMHFCVKCLEKLPLYEIKYIMKGDR